MLSFQFVVVFYCIVSFCTRFVVTQDIIGCGGFVKSEVEINFSLIEVNLYIM